MGHLVNRSSSLTTDRDHTSFSERHRAEVLARTAAAAAHASYYAHPSLHFHSYLPKHHDQTQVLPPMPSSDGEAPGQVQPGLNEPYTGANAGLPPPPSFEPTPAPSAQKDKDGEVKAGTGDPKSKATEGTQEEEGGKARAGLPSGLDNGALEMGGEAGGTHTSPGPTAQQVEEHRAPQNGHAIPEQRPGVERFWSVEERMNPHLQLMCGPLLAYHTTVNGVWHGAAMVVTADAGSNFSSQPRLDLSFHRYNHPSEGSAGYTTAGAQHALQPVTLPSQNIFTYDSPSQGRFSFWRFMIQVPMQAEQSAVKYRLNGGAAMEFVVPAKGQNFRWAAHSCNGFSTGVNPDDFKGDYQSGYDPVWEDMLLKHHQQPFHAMVGGGDQIYCDAITREPELQTWINAPNREKKLGHPLTDEMRLAVDRFYFNHYCKIFRSNAFGRANSTIPMVNMLDDHDLIDGFGTYDDETQSAPVLSYIGGRGYFWFLLFQLFVCDAVDGTNPTPGTHPLKSLIIGAPGAWIPFPSHSLLVYLGPDVSLLAIDCRAERKLHRICSDETYKKLFNEVIKHQGIKQLVILLGVPIAYPRMSFLEHFLDLKWNPLNILARHNALGLGGMVNKFNQASELLDDLNDHWCANVHKKERNWLVLECQKLALKMNARITFLSGDVHLAAVGCLFTKTKHGRKHAIAPETDHRYMLNVVTSAIVNTPPPAGAAKMVGTLAGNKHRTLHDMSTDEIMIPLFEKDTDGSTMKKKYVQPRRNYAAIDYLPSGELLFDIRVEKQPGKGETISYPIKAPAPKWTETAGPVPAKATAHQLAHDEVHKARQHLPMAHSAPQQVSARA